MARYYVLIIALLSMAVYANILNNDFVSDDRQAIVNNPDVGKLAGCKDMVGLSYFLNYHLAKLQPPLYHLTNIGLHALSAVLVFFFLGLFFKPGPSFWGSLVFAVHPVHTEAVTWISGRPYPLGTIFLLASFLLYVRATSGPKLKRGEFCGSLLLHILALYSAAFAFFYPALVALYDFTFRPWRKTWRLWLAYLALSLLRALVMWVQAATRVAQLAIDTGSTGFSNPFFNLVFSFFHHLGLLIWPLRLTLYHEPLVITPLALGIEIFFFTLLILALPRFFKKAKMVFFSICFFILFLGFTYSPVVFAWLVADRYLYLPSVVLSIFIALGLERFGRSRNLKIAAYTVLILLIGAYSARTIIRNRDWRSHASIWRATVRVSPLSPKAHNNMGDVYSGEGKSEEAAGEFSRAIELKPNYADAYHNLALAYQSTGRKDEAVTIYKKAVEINPNLYQSYQNLGVIYLDRGQKQLAKECLKKVLELNPGDTRLRETMRGLGLLD